MPCEVLISGYVEVPVSLKNMPVKLFPKINPTIFEERVKFSLIINPTANMSFKKSDICCLGFDSFSHSLFC